MRVPAVGESRRASAGVSPDDEGVQLLQSQQVEAEPTFTADGPLGLTLSETQIETVYSGKLVHLDEVSPATQMAFPALRPDQLLIKVNGDSILGVDYDRVMEILATTRPLTLTFTSSPHMEDGDVSGAGLAVPPSPGDQYTVHIPSGGSFGFHLRDDGHGDVVIDSFLNEKPAAAGVVQGSLLLWVQGMGVRGMGIEGVRRAIAQCAGAQSVEFVLQAPGSGDAGLDDDLMFDCVFEDPGKLGITFEELPGHDGMPPVLVIAKVEKGTQADRHTYLRPGMEVRAVNRETIVGLSLDAVLDRCTTRPLTLTFFDPQLGAAAGISHVASPMMSTHTVGIGHDVAPATPNILDRVDALLAVGPGPDVTGTANTVGAGGYRSSPSLPRTRDGALTKASSGPLRERRWRRQGDDSEVSTEHSPRPDSVADSADPGSASAADDHDDLLRRIDELYSRQASRMRAAREPATTTAENFDVVDVPQQQVRNQTRIPTGWGARIAAASAATASSWRKEPASYGAHQPASVRQDTPAPPAHHLTPTSEAARNDPIDEIAARRRARESRRPK